ncbi:hypothetical protein SETIT_9G495900v2 [Setaria italica]|uniref:Uncharacterized protein n=1 Tax=Setaria italica TaxID=4555 RepID=A0A368SW79_SETIT|nr:hypothetical protein SETIT_9G495900v2 [Setaria italica]
MAEIDTRPLESVQAAVGIFDRGGDQSRLISPDTNEEEIAILTKELAACKLQLEVRESQHKQAALEIEALEKAVRDLSDQYERDRARIAQLEAENAAIASRQAAADGERGAMRDELAAARAELGEARASVAFVLREVEAMETRAILERESTRDALARILRLNETVLSSAVAAIRAEEERSLFFQEATLEFFNSDRNLEVVRRQVEMAERMEEELLAKTVEIEYLRSELQQVQACELGVRDTEAQTEFTFQHSAEECFVSEIFRNDGHVTTCDETKMEIEVSEDVAEDKQGADVMVQDTTVLEGNSDDQGTSCLDAEISGEDHNAIQSDSRNILAENNQEPAETDSVLPNSTACQGNDLHLQHHEEAKADASFVLESSRDDFQSVHSDAKDTSIAEPGNVAIVETQEQRAEAAAAPTSTPREGNPDTCVVATEIVSNHDDEFYTKELEPERGQGGSKLDGYVLVSKSGDGDVAARDKQLDAARAEISDLRFSLEEAVRRAELAEEAKAALERELREELRRKQQHTPLRRRAPSDSEDGGRPAALEGAPLTPARTRSTPPHAPSGTTPSTGALRNARPGGEDMPTPRGLTLGKVLNMKYK